MGLVRTNIELTNTEDFTLVKKGYKDADSIRSLQINALVDSGAYMLCINEVIKTQLGLDVIEQEIATLADGQRIKMDTVGPVTVKFQNRSTICRALVLPTNNEPLLGAIPMGDMDVLINPRTQTLEINPEHPYMAGTVLKGVRK